MHITTHLVCRLLLAIQPDHLNDAHLQQLVHPRNLIEHRHDPLYRLGHRTLCKEHERIALARRVRLGGEERLDEFGCIGDKVLEFAVDRVHGEDGILAHVRVSVLETCAAGGDQRLKELGVLGDLLEETECCTADVLVWMLLYYPYMSVNVQGDAEWRLTRSLRMALLRVCQGEIDFFRTEGKGGNSHNKNHLLFKLPIVIVLWTNLPVKV